MSMLFPRKSLQKIILVNWARFAAETVRVDGSALFTGVNGAGKSTVLDATTYALCGNTQFNVAAQDRERTVNGYVRGDTRANGEKRFLRKGGITSYIALEFFSPADNFPLTVGVCIESQDELTPAKSYWFVKPDAGIDDFNFYRREGEFIYACPRTELAVKNVRIRPGEFMAKEKGIAQISSALGMRIKGKERDYAKKLVRMMCFKPDNDINRFICENVLEEHPVRAIAMILEQKKSLEKLNGVYDDLIHRRDVLEQLDQVTGQYEKAKHNAEVKEFISKYQELRLNQIQAEKVARDIVVRSDRLEKLKAEQAAAKEAMGRTSEELRHAKNNLDNSDISGTISQLEAKLTALRHDISESEQQIAVIEALQESVNRVVAEEKLELRLQAAPALFRLADIHTGAEEKYSAVSEFEYTIIDKRNELGNTAFELRRKDDFLEQQITEISQKISKLENNRFTFPEPSENARKRLQNELDKRGIKAKVHFWAELVEKVTDESWQDALELFLGWNRFDLIVDDEFVPVAQQLYKQCGIKNVRLVYTDKLPDKPVVPGSAASLLEIPNSAGRKYANFLLNRVHMCGSLEELHEHFNGGLTADRYVSKGYSMYRLDEKNLSYVLGLNAAKLELERNRKILSELKAEREANQAEINENNRLIQVLGDLRLDINTLRFEAVKEIIGQKSAYSEQQIILENHKKDPTFIVLSEACDRAEHEYQKCQEKFSHISSDIGGCENMINDLRRQRDRFAAVIANLQREYDEYSLHHLAVKREALAEYEKLSKGNDDGIALQENTINRSRSDKLARLQEMQALQRKYRSIIGADIELTGEAYIPYFRKELNNISNIESEKAKSRIDAAKTQLQSIFMNEFVAEIKENIDRARNEIDAINSELQHLPFGQDIYTFKIDERPDKAAFFRIARQIDKMYLNDGQITLTDNQSELLDNDIRELVETILCDGGDSDFEDYRNYLMYDMKINKRGGNSEGTDLSRKQGSASNGEKQTPYFIILAASLIQYYPRDRICARIAFIDEAFAALSGERIEQMVNYFEQNGFQVIYAAPPSKISSIGSYINSTISLVPSGDHTHFVEGIADEFLQYVD